MQAKAYYRPDRRCNEILEKRNDGFSHYCRSGGDCVACDRARPVIISHWRQEDEDHEFRFSTRCKYSLQVLVRWCGYEPAFADSRNSSCSQEPCPDCR